MAETEILAIPAASSKSAKVSARQIRAVGV
jgi:hypothetical protein